MTPENIAGMAKVKGVQIIALTDHNSSRNCPAFFKACERHGITAIAGMELTTAEDIHLICLFEQLNRAMEFDRIIHEKRQRIKNRADIFGEQIIMDENDSIFGYEENLLTVATTLSIENAFSLATEQGAVVYPAHIDRQANGIITTLGTFPDNPPFGSAEFADIKRLEQYKKRYPLLNKIKIINSSDAHQLWNINEKDPTNSIVLDDDTGGHDQIRSALFKYLNG